LKNKIFAILAAALAGTLVLSAQVQVSKEPLHKKVLENKYIRLLNVWLQPGDTTQFHVHSTPSLFLHFSDVTITTQVIGGEWLKEQTIPGKAIYRTFFPDSMVHRVSNIDTLPFHVTDAEILSSFKPGNPLRPLPFTLLFENEKVFAYSVTKKNFSTGIINGRGPMIAELVSGGSAYYEDIFTKRVTTISAGGYLFIEPGTSFCFKFKGKEKVNMIIFEIK
jgi:hypothetical protein